jgi:hypothetical protein
VRRPRARAPRVVAASLRAVASRRELSALNVECHAAALAVDVGAVPPSARLPYRVVPSDEALGAPPVNRGRCSAAALTQTLSHDTQVAERLA